MVTVGFSTVKKNTLSRLIRWFTSLALHRKDTQIKFSHAWVRYFHSEFNMDRVIEADVHGIIERSYSKYLKTIDNVVELVPPENFDVKVALAALEPSIGLPYDYGSVIGRIWVYLCGWLGRKVRNPLANTKIDCCVENQLRFLQAGGVLKEVDPETVSPQEIHDKLITLGWKAL